MIDPKKSYVWSHDQLVRYSKYPIETGGFAPTDQYMEDFEGPFAVWPVRKLLDDPASWLCSVCPVADLRWDTLPDNLTVEKFFALIDSEHMRYGSQEPREGTGKRNVHMVYVEVLERHMRGWKGNRSLMYYREHMVQAGEAYLYRVLKEEGHLP